MSDQQSRSPPRPLPYQQAEWQGPPPQPSDQHQYAHYRCPVSGIKIWVDHGCQTTTVEIPFQPPPLLEPSQPRPAPPAAAAAAAPAVAPPLVEWVGRAGPAVWRGVPYARISRPTRPLEGAKAEDWRAAMAAGRGTRKRMRPTRVPDPTKICRSLWSQSMQQNDIRVLRSMFNSHSN